MPRAKKLLGVGADCNTAIKYLHPRKVVCNTFPNATAKDRITNLVAVSKEVKKVNRRDQEVVIFNHEKFDVQPYAVVRWVKVDEEGPDSQFFDEDDEEGEEEVHNGEDGEESGEPIADRVLQLRNRTITNEDIHNVRAMGFGVDDDNDPAPENVPVENERGPRENDSGLYGNQSWGWSGFCNRKKEGGVREKAKINGVNGMVLENIGLVDMFLIFFPRRWFEEVVVAHLKTVDSLRGIEFEEMLRWLGVWSFLQQQ